MNPSMQCYQEQLKGNNIVHQHQNIKGANLEIIFKDPGEIILQLRSSEICQYFLPIWRVLQNRKETSSSQGHTSEQL